MALEVKSLSFSFNNKEIIKDVSFTLNKGEALVLYGPNGSGKTTLLRLLDSLYLPTSGNIYIDNRDTKEEKNLLDNRKSVGFVFSSPSEFLTSDSIEEELAFTLENLCVESSIMHQKVNGALKKIGLYEKREEQIDKLSLKEQIKLMFMSVLIRGIDYLVIDEVEECLNKEEKAGLISFIKDYAKKENVGIVFVTHSPEECLLFDSMIYIEDGKLTISSPDAIFKNISNLSLLPLFYRLKRELNITKDLLDIDELVEYLGEKNE